MCHSETEPVLPETARSAMRRQYPRQHRHGCLFRVFHAVTVIPEVIDNAFAKPTVAKKSNPAAEKLAPISDAVRDCLHPPG